MFDSHNHVLRNVSRAVGISHVQLEQWGLSSRSWSRVFGNYDQIHGMGLLAPIQELFEWRGKSMPVNLKVENMVLQQ